MSPAATKRIQLYLAFPNGFAVIGTSPGHAWLMLGGRLKSRPPSKAGSITW